MAHKVHHGPNLPIVYRLVGPGAHKSAWKVTIFFLPLNLVLLIYKCYARDTRVLGCNLTWKF